MSLLTYFLLLITILNSHYCKHNEIISDCNFNDEKLCDWKTIDGSWKIVTSRNFTASIDGPIKSHRFNSSFLKLTEISSTNVCSILLSPVFNLQQNFGFNFKKIPRTFCLSFDYYLFDGTGIAIELYSVNEDSLIWSQSNALSDKWRRQRLTIQTNNPTIQFRFKVYRKNVAFETVSLTEGKCEYDGSCDFEADTCSWIVPKAKDDEADWKRGSNADDTYYLPPFDHSTSSSKGQFMYTYSKEGNGNIAAKFSSPIHDESFGVHCLSFWYFRSENNADSLSVYMEDGMNDSSRIKLWPSIGVEIESVHRWQFAQTTVGVWKPFRITFEVFKRKKITQKSSIAIDDVNIKPGECQSITNCDFNDGSCGFFIDHSNVTLLHGIGRLQDPDAITDYTHPGDSIDNYFIYSDFTNTIKQTTNMMISEVLSPTVESCLHFSYFINGNTSNQPSRLLVKLQSINPRSELIVFTSTEYKNEWIHNKQDIIGQKNSFKIVFEMIGYDKGSIVAVDNIKFVPGTCSGEMLNNSTLNEDISCDFENGFCHWTAGTSPQSWTISSPSKLSSNLRIPHHDVTTRSASGNYVYFDVIYNETIESELKSSLITSQGWHCISLWYWMDGEMNRNIFKVGMEDLFKSQQVMISKHEDNSDGWQFIQKSYYTDIDHELILYGSCAKCVIAVDDIKVYNGSCPERNLQNTICNFENEQCGFTPADSETVMWKRYEASAIGLPNFRDDNDDPTGHFMALDFENGHSNSGYSKLFSPKIMASENVCVSFGYYLSATNATLNIFTVDVASYEWTLMMTITAKNYKNYVWQREYFELNGHSDLLVVFEGEYDYINNGLLAVDNINIQNGICFGIRTCDFEQPCFWKSMDILERVESSPDNEFSFSFEVNNLWKRRKAMDLKLIDRDFTTQKDHGYLLAMEVGSSNADRHIRAIYKSLLFTSPEAESKACISFAYYTMLSAFSEIRILYGEDDLNLEEVGIIYNEGKTGWSTSRITIEAKFKRFFVYIVGILNSGSPALIGIDDISIAFSTCPVEPELFHCSEKEIVEFSKVCDFKIDCTNGKDEKNCGNCDFQNDFCGYSTENFKIVKTTKPIGNYVEFSAKKETSTDLISPALRNSSPTCVLTFKYKFINCDKCVLALILVINDEKILMWRNTLEQDLNKNDWNTASVAIGSLKMFKLKFLALVRPGWNWFTTNSIQIDDIVFNSCSFESKNEEVCRNDQFKCANNICIDKKYVCDFENDCGDNSDETACNQYEYRCDFEDDICLNYKLNGNWKLSPNSKLIEKGPTIDHSTKNPVGTYLISKDEKSGRFTFDKEIIPRKGCFLRLFYNIFLKESSLKIIAVSEEGSEIIADSVNGPTLFNFKRLTIDLGEISMAKFTLAFEAMNIVPVEKRIFDDYVAIDDISFTPECFNSREVTTTTTTLVPTTTPRPICVHMCGDGKCLNDTEVCNFIIDCDDQSDEINCGNCTFNDNLCGWNNEGFEDWLLVSASKFKDYQFIPNFDANESKTGSFLILRSNDWRVKGEEAVLRSPSIQNISNCDFRLSYFNIFKNDSLQVILNNNGLESILFKAPVTESKQWRSAKVPLPNVTSKVNIEVVASGEYHRWIDGIVPVGIDEISITCEKNSDDLVPLCLRNGHFKCFESDICIPGIMVCDGIKDCPKGEDERNCSTICDEMHYYCPNSNSSCRLMTETCDGIEHCAYGYDESLCNEKKCLNNYCLDGGKCIANAGVPYCMDCPEGTNGKRCFVLGTTEIPSTTPLISTIQPTSSTSTEKVHSAASGFSNSIVIIASVVAAIILLAIIIIIIKYKRNKQSLSFPLMTISNPAYDLALSKLEDSGDHEDTLKSESNGDVDDSKFSDPALSWKRK